MTGRSPEGHMPTPMANWQQQRLLRLLDVRGGTRKATLLSRTEAIRKIELAIDRYRQSPSKVRFLSSTPLPSDQAENAKKIMGASGKLSRVIGAADDETIKRIAIRRAQRFVGETPSQRDRDAARAWLKQELPLLLSDLVGDAQYAHDRARQHGGGGRKPSDHALLSLIVDLARAWVVATGQSFKGTRKSGAAGMARAGAERRYVEFVLTDILAKTLVENQLADYIEDAAQIVRGNEDLESQEDEASGSDRFA